MSSLAVPGSVRSRPARMARVVWRHRAIYVMLAAPLLYFLVFRYLPLWNAQIAFKDFSPIDGVMGSRWIGFQHFLTFFRSIYFGQLIRNTLGYSLAKLLVGMPTAILLALGLAETASRRLRNVVQTASYLPHFLSWVIMYGILLGLLSPGDGLINDILKRVGLQPIAFLTEPRWFPVVVVVSDVWKEAGWSAIIFLAGLLGISVEEYDTAVEEAQGQVVDEAVTEGWLTEEQAEMMRWRLEQAPGSGMGGPGKGWDRSMGGPGMGRLGDNFMSVAAEQLDMTLTELLDALQDGSTIAGLAEEAGVEAQTIVDAYLDGVRDDVAEAVSEGRMTQTQADYYLEQLETRTTDRLDDARLVVHEHHGDQHRVAVDRRGHLARPHPAIRPGAHHPAGCAEGGDPLGLVVDGGVLDAAHHHRRALVGRGPRPVEHREQQEGETEQGGSQRGATTVGERTRIAAGSQIVVVGRAITASKDVRHAGVQHFAQVQRVDAGDRRQDLRARRGHARPQHALAGTRRPGGKVPGYRRR